MILVLGCAWGALLASPCVLYARRARVGARARALRTPRAKTARMSRMRASGQQLLALPGVASVVAVLVAPRRARRRRRHDDRLVRELAVAVDLVGVGVAAGCTPYLAVDLAARWAPELAARKLRGVVQSCARGRSFDDALREAGARTPVLRALTETLRTSARLGSPVAPALARLAAEVRADLRRRAEARARTVPVRLCFPLVGCILPAFALLTVVPVVLDGLHR